MAKFSRKPLSELSPAYRRRIDRAEQLGLSRSQARGHTRKGELTVKDVRKAIASKDWAYREIERVAKQLEGGFDNPEVRQLTKEYKTGISAHGSHKTEEVRKHFRNIRDITAKYRPGEDLDFIVGYGDS